MYVALLVNSIVKVRMLFTHFLYNLQIPSVEFFELRYTVLGMTIVCGSIAVFNTFTVIFTGGVGKNGSTVAVSVTKRNSTTVQY